MCASSAEREDEQAGARTAVPQQPHHDDAEQLQQGDSGLPSTIAASQTVADPTACWYGPEYYTPTYQAPRLGTDARCEPRRSTLGTERRRKACAIHRRADAGVDVVRGSRRAAGRAGLRRLRHSTPPLPNCDQVITPSKGASCFKIEAPRSTAAGSPLPPRRTHVPPTGLSRLNPQVTGLCPARTSQVPGRRTRKQGHHDAHSNSEGEQGWLTSASSS